MSTLFDIMYTQGFYAAMDSVEKALIEHAVSTSGGNNDRASQSIKVNRTTLVMKLRKFGLLAPSKARRVPARKLTLRTQNSS